MIFHDSPEPNWTRLGAYAILLGVAAAFAALAVIAVGTVIEDPTPTTTTSSSSSSTTTTPGVDLGMALHVDAPPFEHPAAAEASRGTPRTTSTSSTTTTTALAAVAAPFQEVRNSREQAAGVGYGGREHLGRFRVTCYDPAAGFPRGQHTASGIGVSEESIAADPRAMGARRPDNRRLELDGIGVGRWQDTGGAVTGKHLDLWRPSCRGWTNPTVDVWLLR